MFRASSARLVHVLHPCTDARLDVQRLVNDCQRAAAAVDLGRYMKRRRRVDGVATSAALLRARLGAVLQARTSVTAFCKSAP